LERHSKRTNGGVEPRKPLLARIKYGTLVSITIHLHPKIQPCHLLAQLFNPCVGVICTAPGFLDTEGDTNIAPPPSIVDPDATERSRFIGHAATAAIRAATGV